MIHTKNRSTKIATSMLAAALAGSMCIPAAAFADPHQPIIPAGDTIAATSVKAGDYFVTISTDNVMLKPTEAVLSVDKKSATVSFNHTGYDFAWLGTIEEYKAADKAGDVTADPRYIRGVETTSLTSAGWLKSGSRFTLPIANLNETFDIAFHNPVKKQMFDRKICVNCADKSALVAAANVKVSVSKAGKLVSDTNAVTTLWYSYAYFGRAAPELHALAAECRPRYAHTFVCAPDFPFEQDGTRAPATQQPLQQHTQLMLLDVLGIPYQVLTGSVPERIRQVEEALGEALPLRL